jgi:hypothetical protein
MRQKILFLLAVGLMMLFSAFTGSNNSLSGVNETIDLIKRSGGTRSATATEVFAYRNNDGWITVEIKNYSGNVWVSVEGVGGGLQQVAQINEQGFVMLDTSTLPNGNYYLRITLENGVYEGYFEK